MQVPDDVLAAVRDKHNRDNAQVAELGPQGDAGGAPCAPTPTAACTRRSGRSVSPHNVDEDGIIRNRVASSNGTIPANIRHAQRAQWGARRHPARRPEASQASRTCRRPNPRRRGSSRHPGSSPGRVRQPVHLERSKSSGGVMDRMSRMIGLDSSERPSAGSDGTEDQAQAETRRNLRNPTPRRPSRSRMPALSVRRASQRRRRRKRRRSRPQLLLRPRQPRNLRRPTAS